MAGGLNGDFNTEALEVDNGSEDEKSCKKVHDVGQVLAVECFMKSALLIRPGEEQVEERDNSSFEFRSTTSVDGGRRESFPDDRFADVGCNEQGNAASKSVALLQQLVEENDDKTGNNQLNDQEDTDTSTKIAGLTIETGKDIDTRLAEGQNDRKELLGGLVEFAICLEIKVDVDEVSTSKELQEIG